MKNKLILASAVLMALAGCASKPKLAPLIAMPTMPAEKRDLIEVNVEFPVENTLTDSAVQLASHDIKSSSSVVINVPSNLFKMKSDQSTRDQEFKTQDFFNQAEQQIERMLIRNGFRVLSRSKFEAKLRTLRDEARCDFRSSIRCLRSSVSPEVRPILEDLEAQFKAGKIEAAEYAEQIKKFQDKLASSSAGKKRQANDNELTDISEVIRAAESGDVQSDYILQINEFDTNNALKVTTDLRYQESVRRFLRDFPGIKNQFESRHSKVTCAVVGSKLNAKLVHVKTGEIVWIGEHELNEFSSGGQKLTLELGNRHYVSNKEEVSDFVYRQNTHSARLARYGQSVTVPEFKFADSLITPTLTSGECESQPYITDEDKARLARQVAKELINTIKVSL